MNTAELKVFCLDCKGEGVTSPCTDPHCIERGECIHPDRYEDCESCDGEGYLG